MFPTFVMFLDKYFISETSYATYFLMYFNDYEH